jgi:predicted protein tyrosine phosphatase
MIRLLFICSRNQWRSPTAEQIFKGHPDYQSRSAGTSPRAKRRLKIEDLNWADKIFVMETKHRNKIQADFGRTVKHKTIHVLDIPDQYKFNDPELIQLLEHTLLEYLSD